MKSWQAWIPWVVIAVAIACVFLFGVWSYEYQNTPIGELPALYWLFLVGRVLLLALAVVALSYLWETPSAIVLLGALVGLMWLGLALFQVSSVGWNGETIGTLSSGVGFLVGGAVAFLLAQRAAVRN